MWGASRAGALLQLFDDCGKGFGVVHSQVGEHFSVEGDVRSLKRTHKFRIRHPVLAGTGVNALYPEGAEVSLFGLPVAIGVRQGFLNSILGYGVDVFSAAKVAFGGFQYFLSALSGSY